MKKGEPTITFGRGVYLCFCDYEDRFLVKQAGFKWDAENKSWYSETSAPAARLRGFCDAKARRELDRTLLNISPWAGELEVPKGLKLYPFQETAILHALSRNRSYLGLDPGLGKTICAAIISATLKENPLYICPPFLVKTVEMEFEKWAPSISPKIVPDTQLNKITNLKGQLLFVDEAHRFKNERAKRTETLFRAIFPNFERVYFLSGTPMPNSPIELYTVLSNAAPETIEFKSKFQYGFKYCQLHQNSFGWDFSGASNLKELKSRVIPKFMIRYRKAEVLPELPPKTENMVILHDKLPAAAARLDLDLLKTFSPQKATTQGEHVMRYRRILGLAKVKPALAFIESKLEETNESVLVFAVHKEVISTLCAGLEKYSPLHITGDTPMGVRKERVELFQSDKNYRVFIGNIQACGTGFTLTKATRVIFVEFAYVPGENDQASDRAHRIGQKDNVLVHYLVYKNTYDRAVLETLLTKRFVTGAV